MSDAGVAADTVGRLLAFRMADHGRNALVATQAVMLRHIAVHRRDLDRFVEIARRERHAVVVPVDPFHGVFGDDGRVRRVAIVAAGYGLVAATIPTVVDIAHDVTVGAGFGIIRQIRRTLGVQEGIAAQTCDPSDDGNQRYPDRQRDAFEKPLTSCRVARRSRSCNLFVHLMVTFYVMSRPCVLQVLIT
jgi:hypothetical protein